MTTETAKAGALTKLPTAGQGENDDFDMVPWKEVAIQFDPVERALYEAAFAGARSSTYIADLTIKGRRYMIAPSGKVWLLVTKPHAEGEDGAGT